MINEASH